MKWPLIYRNKDIIASFFLLTSLLAFELFDFILVVTV